MGVKTMYKISNFIICWPRTMLQNDSTVKPKHGYLSHEDSSLDSEDPGRDQTSNKLYLCKTDTSMIWTLSPVPLMSVLKRFDCICQDWAQSVDLKVSIKTLIMIVNFFRAWNWIRGLPRRHCSNAGCFRLGCHVLLYAVYYWTWKSGDKHDVM